MASGSTTNFSLSYPISSDVIDLHGDIQALAEDVDTQLLAFAAAVSPSTDDAIVRFDGTTGVLQNSGVTIDDSNNLTVPGGLTVDRTGTAADAIAVLDADAGQNSILRLMQAGSHAWQVRRIATSHDLGFYTHGTLNNFALTLDYDTGDATFAAAVSVTDELELGGSGGPTITTGTALPSASEPQGSQYHRDTTLGDGLYIATDDAGTWQVLGGDTGIRNLSAESMSNSWAVYSSTFSLRRMGNTVELYLRLDPGSATAAAVYTLPSGFRPWFDLRDPVLAASNNYNNSAFAQVQSSGVISVVNYSTGESIYTIVMNWQTQDAWPTSLPGSAA